MSWSVRFDGRLPKTGDTSQWLSFRLYQGDEPKAGVQICRSGSLDTLVLRDRYEAEEVDLATARSPEDGGP